MLNSYSQYASARRFVTTTSCRSAPAKIDAGKEKLPSDAKSIAAALLSTSECTNICPVNNSIENAS